MSTSHLVFQTNIGKQKPENITAKGNPCPFCEHESLEAILEIRDSIIWLKNKYNVLQDALQTVIIETDQCDSELSIYPKEHLYKVIRFAVEKWQQMNESGEFQSVMLYKNHGPYSGGSIIHPHMQIVGLHRYNYMSHVRLSDFEGIELYQADGIECNLSTKPRVGFYEFNIRLSNSAAIDKMADFIQIFAHYILHSLNTKCSSYNVFFYQLDRAIGVKVVPRFATSPLFIGYSIPQVSSNLEEMVEDIRNRYLGNRNATV